MRLKLLIILILLAIAATAGYVVQNERKTVRSPEASPTSQTSPPDTSEIPEPTFDKTQFSLTTPSSVWVVVNKKRPLPSSYIPSKLRIPKMSLRSSSSEMLLRDDAADALEALVGGAKKAGHNLLLASGYRSYALQQSVYNNFVRKDGAAAANRYSAKPRYSEHQTGLAADIGTTNRVCEIQECFATTQAGKWIAKNAHTYGFIIRYPKGKEAIVGYTFEPWHLRYVGKDLAREIFTANTTMEQFFGLPAAPNY